MAATLDFPVQKIVYVMTDFTDANVKFWRNHPELRPYFERGMMDSAIFDAVSEGAITLTESGVTLKPGTVKNPLCECEQTKRTQTSPTPEHYSSLGAQ